MSKSDAIKIMRTGLDSARPENFLGKYISGARLHCAGKSYRVSDYGSVWLVSMGKAADSMARAVSKTIPVTGGIIVIPKSHTPLHLGKKFKTIKSGHPVPDKNSVLAARKIIIMLQNAKRDDLVIFLVSGGTSSLVCAPEGITLRQKIQTTLALLKSGASISEINAIRKHLSGVKGGKVLEHLHCPAIAYVMSDVVGNDLGSIGSGIVYYDKTTFAQCLGMISKYGLGKKIPKAVLSRLQNGARKKIPETPKKPKIPNQVIAQNLDCLDAMMKTARKLRYKTTLLPNVTGDVRLAANKILRKFNAQKNPCLVFGGETTVQVRGKGKGGRNQELILRMILKLPNDTIVASVGTDGIDGNTKNAGAVFDHKMDCAIVQPYLDNNDSNSFFVKYGGLVTTGPTRTNLLDIGIILKHLR